MSAMREPTKPSVPSPASEFDPAEVFGFLRSFFDGCRREGIEVSSETRSMWPLLRGGESLHWRDPSPAPRFGDVVIFFLPPRSNSRSRAETAAELSPPVGRENHSAVAAALSGLVVHRVIRVFPDGRLQTKGDARPGADLSLVSAEHVLGVVSRLGREGRNWRLEGRRARFYGIGAAWVSRICSRLPRVRGAWRLQWILQGIWYALLFRLCHSSGGRGAA